MLRPGVNVFGYVFAESGVGEVTRLLVETVKEAGIPYSVVPCTRTQSRQENRFGDRGTGEPAYDINIVGVNADEFPGFVESYGREFFASRYTIAVWAWEVEAFPEWMARSAAYVDEVWGISRHTSAAISRRISQPVYPFPLPIAAPASLDLSRSELGLPDGFLFLFCFDFDSVFERKNPLAIVEAFKLAFEEGEGACLLIKSVNGDRPAHSQALASLQAAASQCQDIQIVDGYLPPDHQPALVKACDAYVSLHRAEGFGLTLAEAMASGKPVIATAYSGNLDFMNDANSYLVPFKPVEIPKGCAPYPPGSSWAEPDVNAAARLMREVYEDPQEVRRKTTLALQQATQHHTPAARAASLLPRLEAIHRNLAKKRGLEPTQAEVPASSAPPAPEKGLQFAVDLIQHGPDLGRRTSFGGIGRLLRRTVFRLLRNYHLHQQQVDLVLAEAIQACETRLGTPVERAHNRADEVLKLAAGVAKEVKVLRTRHDHFTDEIRAAAQVRSMALEALRADMESERQERLDLARTVGGFKIPLQELRAAVDDLQSGLRSLRGDLGTGRQEQAEVARDVGRLGNDSSELRRELAAQSKDHDAFRAELETKRAETAGMPERLEREIRVVSTAIDGLSAGLKALGVVVETERQQRQGVADEARSGLSQASAVLDALKNQRHEDLAGLRTSHEEVHRGLDTASTELVGFKTRLEEVRGQLGHISTKLEVVENERNGELANLTTAHEEMRGRLCKVATDFVTVKGGLEEVRGGLNQVSVDLDQVKDALPQSDGIAGLKSQLSTLQDELSVEPYMAKRSVIYSVDDSGGEFPAYRGGDDGASIAIYRKFEDLFRGPESFIRERQRGYLELLQGCDLVVDFGCGRGEMLELLAESKIPAVGVDVDPGMVEHASAKGFRVEHMNGLEYLAQQADFSIGAIFSAQVIEHLSYEELLQLFRLARVKLLPGGRLITETVNPHSFRAFKSFWVDPTHQRPLYPEALLALSKFHGFAEGSILFPNGSGCPREDRVTQGEYALVATNSEAEGNNTEQPRRRARKSN